MARVIIDWNKVKEDYFQDYFTTLEDVAKKHNISYSWIRKKSMKEKWPKQKKKTRKRAFDKAMKKVEKLIVEKIVSNVNHSQENKGQHIKEQMDNNYMTFI